jgi:hypothetical protein
MRETDTDDFGVSDNMISSFNLCSFFFFYTPQLSRINNLLE